MVVLLISSAFADYDPQYVSRVSGDTLFVKDDIEFGGTTTLTRLMESDSLAPATRVYFLKSGGIYSCIDNPASSKNYRTIIMGPEQNLKTGSPTMPPPIISGSYAAEVGGNGMNINKDLLIKNIDLELGNSSGNTQGWAFFNFSGPNMRLEVDNCIMEHTWWTWVGGPPGNQSIFFNNCYFVNLDGHSCRRNGGVVDFNSTTKHQDTLSVQNCTHVNTQGTLYKFRNGYTVDKVLFNHNTFINNSGFVFMNNGDQTNMSVTNNIFVNCQLQAYDNTDYPTDVFDPDTNGFPMGFINLYADSTFTLGVGTHGVYVDKNLTYWDTSLSNIVSTLNTNQVNGSTEWVSQMINMNTRTAGLFADKTHYPKLTNGTWFSKLPTFAKTDVLFTTQLAVVKAYAIAAVDTGYKTPMKSWRQASNPEASNFVHADWPIPIDLSYTDSDLLTAGLGGFPLGDLGWFPTQYALWKAQEATELANIQRILDGNYDDDGVAATEHPRGFQLQQNYPNPFNPTTTINYDIPQRTFVSVKIYDVLGRDAGQLVNEEKQPGRYSVRFDGTTVSSGVYFYSITAGSFHRVRKMVLMK
jgi:hypothetical protein